MKRKRLEKGESCRTGKIITTVKISRRSWIRKLDETGKGDTLDKKKEKIVKQRKEWKVKTGSTGKTRQTEKQENGESR